MFIVSPSAISATDAFAYSVVFTAAAFFLIGIIKGRVVQKPLLRSAFSTLLVGGLAASVAFLVGYLLNLIV
jgi:VIT1/CCC1 family predicted Fe2+/Mn2+ transporter